VFVDLDSHYVESTAIQFAVVFSVLKRTDGETKWNKYCIIYIHKYLRVFSVVLVISFHPLPLGYVTGMC